MFFCMINLPFQKFFAHSFLLYYHIFPQLHVKISRFHTEYRIDEEIRLLFCDCGDSIFNGKIICPLPFMRKNKGSGQYWKSVYICISRKSAQKTENSVLISQAVIKYINILDCVCVLMTLGVAAPMRSTGRFDQYTRDS